MNDLTEATPPSSSSLDKWTNCDESGEVPLPAYRLLFRNYGEGDAEATVTIATIPRNRSKGHGAPSKATDPRRTVENMQRAQQRAKTTIRRSIMAAKLDHLLTLTYRDNEQDRERAWSDFTRFARLVRDTLKPFSWPYVAVLEFQKRGAIHFHVAVSGFQKVELLRSIWHHVIGGGERGNIDVQFFRGRRSQLARYLAKYLSKDIGDEKQKGTHRYKRSRGIQVPATLTFLPHDADLSEELIAQFRSNGATLRYHKNTLFDAGAKFLWACSW